LLSSGRDSTNNLWSRAFSIDSGVTPV
jgi:hypothetical protein